MFRHSLKSVVLTLCVGAGSTSAFADFLPPNNFHLEKSLAPSNINKSQFDQAIDKMQAIYQPIVAKHGRTLRFNRYWTDNTVNAYANQNGNVWTVSMYGGLARRPEITLDGFTAVICHELGHHLGGFPFVSTLSNEGQSDYFATLSCLRKVWANDLEENAKARELIPVTPRNRCNDVWLTEAAQNLCYRAMLAGKSAADMLAKGGRAVSFENDDLRTVSSTNHSHPAAQCRLDTYEAGALCVVDFDSSVIPGKRFNNRNGIDAERESAQFTCTQANTDDISIRRPRCWFYPRSL